MSPAVELDSGLEGDYLLDSSRGLRLGLEGREGGFDGVEVGNVGLVVFLMVQLHDIFDDMRFEGLFHQSGNEGYNRRNHRILY